MEDRMKVEIDCKTYRSHLADLLLDEMFASRSREVAAHGDGCAECRAALEELQATFVLLDGWSAPEPSVYFDAKLHARLREVQASAPEGLWGRLRAFALFSTEHRLRPAMAGVLALAVVLGGGGMFAGLYQHPAAIATQASPAVNDLKIMDNNAQALQQMDQLLDSGGDGSASTPPTT